MKRKIDWPVAIGKFIAFAIVFILFMWYYEWLGFEVSVITMLFFIFWNMRDK